MSGMTPVTKRETASHDAKGLGGNNNDGLMGKNYQTGGRLKFRIPGWPTGPIAP